MTQRTPGWRPRLNALVLARLGVPFGWGPADCAWFVADAVAVQHECDTLAPLRGPRRTALQAARQIRAAGGPAVLARCGLEPVRAGLAGFGDVVLLQQGRHYLLGLCNGSVALAPGAQGLLAVPMRAALAGWRV